MIPKGKIKQNQYNGITVYFVVDDLMKGDTPHTNFWTFCLLNNLVEKDPNDSTRFRSKINRVDLFWSEEEEYNERIIEMFEKLNIEIL